MACLVASRLCRGTDLSPRDAGFYDGRFRDDAGGAVYFSLSFSARYALHPFSAKSLLSNLLRRIRKFRSTHKTLRRAWT
jgi:hypothetical protein